MIDPKELRIGNIVNVKSLFPYPVLGVDDYGCKIGRSTLPWELISPAPITETNLFKLGFSYDVDYYVCKDVNQYGFHFSENLEYIVIVDDEDRDLPEVSVNHIKYVHQLQNLVFALTGEELSYA